MKKLQKSLFDEEERIEKLLKMNDSLERLNEVIEWETFRRALTRASRKEDSGKGGRPAYDVVMMFKILILQRLYNLSDEQMEYQINDRLSFMKFLGLNIEDNVPDAKTIWKFRNDLAEAELDRELFYKFDCELERQGLITHSGTIVDATFVEVPKQRNHHDENKKIKNGEIPEDWQKPENADEFPFQEYDYIVDAVDTVTAKIELIMKAQEKNVPVISCMGAGNKLDGSQFKVSDIYKTKMCPLAKVMRRELKKRGVRKLKVVYSEEKPIRPLTDMSISCRTNCICPPGAKHKCTERRELKNAV